MNTASENQRKILQEVVSLPTAPLCEQQVASYIRTFAGRLGLPVRQDMYGNLLVEYVGDAEATAFACVAHMDHPGFVVEGSEKGLCKLAFRGGAACPAPGDKLTLFAGDGESLLTVEEVMCAPVCVKQEGKSKEETPKPTHVLASSTSPLLQSLAGGFAMHQLPPFRLDGDMVYSRAIDDLAGCAALLAVLELLVEQRPNAHFYAIFTRAEEIGFIGAYGLAMSKIVPPQTAFVSLEASKMLPGAEQGKGVVVRLGDRRAIFDAKISTFLSEVAQELATQDTTFLFQRRLLDGGACEGALFNAFGYPSSGLAVPLACYHNQGEHNQVAAENIHLRDWYGMVRLVFAAATRTCKLVGWEQSRLAYFTERFNKYRDVICPPPSL